MSLVSKFNCAFRQLVSGLTTSRVDCTGETRGSGSVRLYCCQARVEMPVAKKRGTGSTSGVSSRGAGQLGS